MRLGLLVAGLVFGLGGLATVISVLVLGSISGDDIVSS